jgi:hypothetical protein
MLNGLGAGTQKYIEEEGDEDINYMLFALVMESRNFLNLQMIDFNSL